MSWEAVIGIEIHVQLRTGRKLFCGDLAEFGAAPNSHVCPVCLGLPGALPVADPAAVALAVKTALALDCTLQPRSVWARKHYFYPDLPKGYQITQFEEPIATGGVVRFDGPEGEGSVRIRRIHMEEDAGKLVHDHVPGATAVDLNRAGTPLVEIVTEPDLRTAGEARAFLGALKQILEYVDVSDCNMEEGSLRADANVSLRSVGSDGLGTKTEIKNVNSFSGIERALEIEIDRQRTLLSRGGSVEQQTLLWDDHRAQVRPMRSKEESNDYRYFPDPDLPPLELSKPWIEGIREVMPELPRTRRARLVRALGLSEYDAGVLTRSVTIADYFEVVVLAVGDAKLVANWVMGPLLALTNDRVGARAEGRLPVPASDLAELLRILQDGRVSDGAAKKVLEIMAREGGSPGRIVQERGLSQVRDVASIEAWVREAVDAHPLEVTRYRAGETRVLGFLMGQVMKRSAGRADPKRAADALRDALGQ